MGTDNVTFVVELCGGATGSRVTGSDVSDVAGSGPDRKYVLRIRNRKLRNIRPNGSFLPEAGYQK